MTISECVRLLREQDDFLIVTHVRPDGDTLCSAAALCSGLRRAGKNAFILDNPEITETYADLVAPFITNCRHEGQFLVSVDLATESLFPRGFSDAVDLCIDHHGSNSGYAKHSLVEPQMAACAEIIMRVIEQLCGKLTLEEAELLYIGLATDCGCFCFGNTVEQTFLDAAHLVSYGVKNGSLNKRFFRSFSRSRLALEGMIYTGLRSYLDGKINVAVITRDMMLQAGAREEDCDDLASLAGKVRGNVVSITVRELEGGRSKASVRSNRSVNSSEICARLGGGGHFMAAGCTADMGPFELADKLLEYALEILS